MKRTQPTAESARRRLRRMLAAFVCALGLPVWLLAARVYDQLEQEARYRYRGQAEALVDRIEERLRAFLEVERQRSFADYSFFTLLENPLLPSAGVTVSPLASLPPSSAVPGIVGYFQIDPDGSFHSPVLPDVGAGSAADASPGFDADERRRRALFRERLRALLLAGPGGMVDERPADRGAEGTVDSIGARPDRRPPEEGVYQAKRSRARFDRLFRSPSEPTGDADFEPAPVRSQAKKSAPQGAPMALAERANAVGTMVDRGAASQPKWLEPVPVKGGGDRTAAASLRKERVRLPDQVAAGALFERARAKPEAATSASATAIAPGRTKEAGLTSVVEAPETDEPDPMAVAILRFDSEIGPLQRLSLESGYDCFFRWVWRDGSRYVQGFIVKRNVFLRQLVAIPFRASPVASVGRLQVLDSGVVVLQLEPIASYRHTGVRQRSGAAVGRTTGPLYVSRLEPPLQAIELRLTGGVLSDDSGVLLVDLAVAVLAFVLICGSIGFYRLGIRQIELVRQQGNFVSAVSHELKTPLTAMRMYSEMLRSGWVSDEKRKRAYYDHIFFESERLSRLIANVLQLSTLEHRQEVVRLQPFEPGALLETVRETLALQAQAAGFELRFDPPEPDLAGPIVQADADAFACIVINLVDNALKFSSDCAERRVDVGWRRAGDHVLFFVRDYGPGIERGQKKRIFRLFYRAGDEMTRTRPGTGIGLALVQQLAAWMNASVEPADCRPGVEFQLRLPV